jgi:hypothetical protein
MPLEHPDKPIRRAARNGQRDQRSEYLISGKLIKRSEHETSTKAVLEG